MQMYRVESFNSEFKVDKASIKKLLVSDTTTLEDIRQLYPPLSARSISEVSLDDIPSHIIRRNYYVQRTNDECYSLKARMLSDLRAKRSAVRKQMASVTDPVERERLNSKQLAIKVIMNTEYGASANKVFAHYDPDVAAGITYTSRQLIGFLTQVLQSNVLYVDDQFIRDNMANVQHLQEIGVLTLTPHTRPIPRRLSLERLFTDTSIPVVCMTIVPSTVLYQDTDSNYYVNRCIAEAHQCDTSMVHTNDMHNERMCSMVIHNNLISAFVASAVNRSPIGAGYDGAMIIARFLPRKKKYYGLKWSHSNRYTGQTLTLDSEKLFNELTNYLDYVVAQGIKVIGVDLTRRDQYKYINYFHLKVLQDDLRITDTHTSVSASSTNASGANANTSIASVVNDNIELFRATVDRYCTMAQTQEYVPGEIDLSLSYFSRTMKYNPSKHNIVTRMVKRMTKEPPIGSRVYYVLPLSDEIRQSRLDGRSADQKITESAYMVDEVLDKARQDTPVDTYTGAMPYDDYINAKAISTLDFKYYLKQLAASTALYILGDDDSPSAADKIANACVKRYFNYGVSLYKDIRDAQRTTHSSVPQLQILMDMFPNLTIERIHANKYEYIQEIRRRKNRLEAMYGTYNSLMLVLQNIRTNRFTTPSFANEVEQELYQIYRYDEAALVSKVNEIHRLTRQYDSAIEVLSDTR